MEDLKRTGLKAVTEVINFTITDFKLINENTAQQKEYYNIYMEFIEKIKLPKDYIELMYNSKFMKHFYT